MEDLGHFPQRHFVLLSPEKPLQHVLLLRHPCFLLLPPQHPSQHQDFLLKQLPLVPDQYPPSHVAALGPAPGERFRPYHPLLEKLAQVSGWIRQPGAGERVQGITSWVATQGGQRLAPLSVGLIVLFCLMRYKLNLPEGFQEIILLCQSSKVFKSFTFHHFFKKHKSVFICHIWQTWVCIWDERQVINAGFWSGKRQYLEITIWWACNTDYCGCLTWHCCVSF